MRGGFRPARLLQAPDNPAFGQIVGGHLHLDAVADGEADPAFAHFAADRGQDQVFVGKLDAKHRAGEHGVDAAFNFNVFFFHGWQRETPGLKS